MDALHTTVFYTNATNFKSLVPVRRASIPFLYECEFCTCSHSLLASSLLPNLFPTDGIIFEGSKEVEIWGSKIWDVW